MKMTTRSRTTPDQELPLSPQTAKGSAKLTPFAIIVIVIVLGTAGVLALNNAFHKPVAPQPEAASAPASSETDIAQLLKAIGRHIVVNTSETPTVATITDADLLRSQMPAFYKDAQNGDRLVVWSDKAVLYSPSRDILLAVVPVSSPPAGQTSSSTALQPSASSSTQVAEQATIEVRNGSGTAGLGKIMAQKLKAAGFSVLAPTDAKSSNYPKTIIVKATDKPLPQTLAALQTTIRADVVTEPPAEGPIKGDFLVIVGADFTK